LGLLTKARPSHSGITFAVEVIGGQRAGLERFLGETTGERSLAACRRVGRIAVLWNGRTATRNHRVLSPGKAAPQGRPGSTSLIAPPAFLMLGGSREVFAG
jgi:hypothetical protein